MKIELQKTTLLPVVLYNCGKWYLTVRETYITSVFKNMNRKRTSGHKNNETR
jgi:hypothetical protein